MSPEFVSVFGIITLLGIAWAMSLHRREVRFRPVIWGLSLQFLFALIILREDGWSLGGTAILGLLVLLFMLQRQVRTGGAQWGRAGSVLLGLIAAGIAVGTLAPAALVPAMVVLVVALIANARFRLLPSLQRPGGMLLVVLAVSWVIANNVTGQAIFGTFSAKVAAFLNLSDYGSGFLFGNLIKPSYFFTADGAAWPGFGFQFAFKVLPTIIFFGGFMGVLYHLGIMQKVIEALARFMRWTLGTSGAETLSCSANIFVGQTEAPLLIKPFLDGMTASELLTVMVGGFATIAGGVLAGYIALGIPATHLIAASVMAAPGALAIGKLVFPEKEHSETAGDVGMPEVSVGGNVIEAATNGIGDGLRLAVNVGAMLIGFIALIAVVDVLLGWADGLIDGRLLHGAYVSYSSGGLSPITGEYQGIFPGSLQTLFGTLLRPIAFLMGVPWADAATVGNLLGIKLSLNEFVAYGQLSTYMQAGTISPRAIVISTYALCGFANFSSIGIQIGGISAVAPGRKSDLARLGLRAMFAGAITSALTASIAGLLL